MEYKHPPDGRLGSVETEKRAPGTRACCTSGSCVVARPTAERMRKMSTRLIVHGLATLTGAAALVLSVFSGRVLGDGEASTIRWDIQHYPNLVLQPGGEAFADAVDGSKIRFMGSGTFKTDGHDVTGGGTWKTFAASGALTGSGTYRVLNLVSWHAAPGTLPCPPITDDIAPCADARAGLAVLQIQYPGGGVVGSPTTVYEGVTVSKGFVDYYLPENPDLTMNGTIFHVVHKDDE
jgi:hypothetical protein